MGAYETLLDELAAEARRRPDRHLFGYNDTRPRSQSAASESRRVRVRAAAANLPLDPERFTKSLAQLERLVSGLPSPRPPVIALTYGERVAAARMLRDGVMSKAMNLFSAGEITGQQVAEIEQLANAGVSHIERVSR